MVLEVYTYYLSHKSTTAKAPPPPCFRRAPTTRIRSGTRPPNATIEFLEIIKSLHVAFGGGWVGVVFLLKGVVSQNQSLKFWKL